MKRLLPLLGLFLTFALPNHAQTQTDTIKFEVRLEDESATLEYKFTTEVRSGIEIEWVSANGTESGKFRPNADGNYTQSISGNGTGYIYYTYEQGISYSAYLSSDDYLYGSYDINILTRNNRIITSLDVRGCTALMELQCWINQLMELDVSGCPALTELWCYGNQLTSLNVSGCTALTTLSCGENQLTSLDLSKNTALTTLSCDENQLTSLDLSKNTALTELWCSGNQLTALDLSKNTALTHLSVTPSYGYYGVLTSLDVSGCTSLTELNCSRNQLTSLDVSGCTALPYLDCSDNQLTDLDVSDCTALTSLNCSRNQLTSLDVSGCTALMHLVCRDNQLTDLDVSHNTALTTLYCEYNHIPLSELYKVYSQVPVWNHFSANQSDSMVLRINQLFDLSAERLIGKSASTFELSVYRQTLNPDYWSENNFVFRFLKPLQYTLTLYNPIFEDVSFTWHISVIDEQQEGYYSVQVNPNNAALGSATIMGNGLYKEGSEVTITATANEGCRFVNWTKNGAEFSTEAEYTFAVTEDLELTANFEEIPPVVVETYTVSLAVNNPAWGNVFQSGNGIYEEGVEIMITANANEGYRFVNWTNNGTEFSKEAVYKFAVTENLELIANFEKNSGDVANETQDKDNFYVYTQDRNIVLSETRGAVQVFNAVGQCVYSGNATIIPVRQRGMYVVRVGTNVYKVLVK